MAQSTLKAELATPVAHVRPFASAFLAPVGDGSRRRSGADVARLILAVLGIAALGSVNRYSHYLFGSLGRAVYPPPHVIDWIVTALWLVGCIGGIALMLVSAVMTKRVAVIRDVVIAGAVSWVTCLLIQEVFGVRLGLPSTTEAAFPGANLGFPQPLLAVAAGVIFVSLPYLSRTLQRLIEILLGIVVVTGFVHGAGLPFSLLASVIVGWGAAAVAHLAFGTPLGVPSADDVVAALDDLDIDPTDVSPVPHQQWGLTRFTAQDAAHGPIRISLYSRDARQSQLALKLYRTIAYRRDSAPFSWTRVQQIEHEAYMTLMVERAAPHLTSRLVTTEVVGPSHEAVVVTASPPGQLLATVVDRGGAVGRSVLVEMADGVRRLHADEIAHGAVSLDTFVVTDDHAGLVDFDRTVTNADELSLRTDVAGLLVTMALASDDALAVDVAVDVLGADVVVAALPLLQGASLPPRLQASIRKAKDRRLLKELAAAAAAATSVDVPELEELKRFSWGSIVLAAGTAIGGWALIVTLLNASKSASVIAHAQIGWVVVAAVVSALTFVGSALSVLGTITDPLPFFPLVMLELSNTFTVLTVSGAVTAARVRFFQRQGMDPAVAISSGMLVGTASWVAKGVMLAISIPLAANTISVQRIISTAGIKNIHVNTGVVLAVLVAVLVLVGLVVFIVAKVPKSRKAFDEKVVPHIDELRTHLKELARSPRKLVELLSGQVVAQLVTALALGAGLAAFHQHLSVAACLVVVTFGGIIGSVSPVPGGMGVVEAGMTLCLKACGIPVSDAVAAVFIQRLFTGYLPPVGGWVAMLWMRRKELL